MEQIKERPILFSGAMVRAILEGRKNQTRRVIKNWGQMTGAPASFPAYDLEEERGFGFESEDCCWRSPYGKPGDRLWVRETWGYRGMRTFLVKGEKKHEAHVKYHADDVELSFEFPSLKEMCAATPKQNIKYPDGFNQLDTLDQHFIKDDLLTAWWKRKNKIPSIHMPRWAARLILNVKSIRVERLQDVSEKDARAEGVPPNWAGDLATEQGMWNPDTDGFLEQDKDLPPSDDYYFCDGRIAFKSLWDSINGKRIGCSWDDNPFVWVVEFERC